MPPSKRITSRPQGFSRQLSPVLQVRMTVILSKNSHAPLLSRCIIARLWDTARRHIAPCSPP